jgi:hypothetical protein
LANRFRPVEVDSQALEWKSYDNGEKLRYGGKEFTRRTVASKGLGLPGRHLPKWCRETMTPDGEVLDLVVDCATREEYLSDESILRLKSRFVYADNGESLGPCRIFGMHSERKLDSIPDVANAVCPVLDYLHPNDLIQGIRKTLGIE